MGWLAPSGKVRVRRRGAWAFQGRRDPPMTVLMAELHPAWFLRRMAGWTGDRRAVPAHPLTDAVPTRGCRCGSGWRVTLHVNCGRFNKIGVKT